MDDLIAQLRAKGGEHDRRYADARRCLYCNAALPVREGAGRPSAKGRCKQRWSEGRAELEGAGT